MITLTITVDNIATVISVYDRVRIRTSTDENASWDSLSDLTTFPLVIGQSTYTYSDADGDANDWYVSQYYLTTNSGIISGWSDPILGEEGDIYYNPLYPPEISYGTADQLVIDRIRRLIGDPIGLRREYGEDAASSIHPDNKTYELDEKGWPCDVHMNGVAMNSSTDPTINGYRYLKFDQDISDQLTTWSGCVEYGVDIWYYTFRNADREIMEAYDTAYPPYPLTTANATSEVYMLQTAVTLLSKELIEDSTEDGAIIRDEGTSYSPEPGLGVREAMIDKLQKRLDNLVKGLSLTNITGVLID